MKGKDQISCSVLSSERLGFTSLLLMNTALNFFLLSALSSSPRFGKGLT